ncbi:hypothetical protein MH215_28980, partial [Paenibacillus sp. ACRSA]|uniref:hypothetical protein n=1 Tax=Paenibacillus sp. ACRSA TaxID=2918211 RepID=UPI001EF4CC59
RLNMDCRSSHEQQRSGGDGIDSGEAARSRLSPDFPLTRGIQEIRRQPAIGRTIHPRNVHHAAPDLPYYSNNRLNMDCRSSHEQQRSGGDGIDSGEAARSRLSPDFPLTRGIQEIRRQPAIGRTIHPRNATMLLQIYPTTPIIDSTWIAEVAMSSNVVEGTELILEKRSGRV